MKILVTGAAGFIGFHLCKKLAEQGDIVIGLDNFNDYYDVNLKRSRHLILQKYKNFQMVELDLENREGIAHLFAKEKFHRVVNLAAQAGVRYSIENPHVYVESNIIGFLNILEGCRHQKVEHLVFASSSSVYGLNTQMPFSTHHNVDHPISLYAATKKANELMAHTYAHLYRIPMTGLRFFTVYGPWGRPDMALFKFTQAILQDKPIDVYNYGKMQRDFTYIDDIVTGVVKVLDRIPEPSQAWTGEKPDPCSSPAPYYLYNIGNNHPVELSHFIKALENALGKVAKKNRLPMQPGDVAITYADVDDLQRDVGFRPQTPIETGIKRFVEWYLDFYSGAIT
ncbi:MAG: capsular biosynthesis protein CpsI [Beggiatoa sp. IS2]|nr:MAG: capsular biosynthesis protein CpsI [Beggiatoa sp. IS2]